jgi:hypothetical protein
MNTTEGKALQGLRPLSSARLGSKPLFHSAEPVPPLFLVLPLVAIRRRRQPRFRPSVRLSKPS